MPGSIRGDRRQFPRGVVGRFFKENPEEHLTKQVRICFARWIQGGRRGEIIGRWAIEESIKAKGLLVRSQLGTGRQIHNPSAWIRADSVPLASVQVWDCQDRRRG